MASAASSHEGARFRTSSFEGAAQRTVTRRWSQQFGARLGARELTELVENGDLRRLPARALPGVVLGLGDSALCALALRFDGALVAVDSGDSSERPAARSFRMPSATVFARSSAEAVTFSRSSTSLRALASISSSSATVFTMVGTCGDKSIPKIVGARDSGFGVQSD